MEEFIRRAELAFDKIARLRAEIARLRAAIADAEERGRAAERADVLAWIDATPDRWTMGERPWAPVARALQRGEHVGAAARAKGASDQPMTSQEDER